MKKYMAAGFLMLAYSISAAYADNSNVENAVKNRPDLSRFYQALVGTGVNHELDANATYTIFAPTNGAFSQISQEQYPCFYTAECPSQAAAIVRNHIIPGEVMIGDATWQTGGFFSIGGRFITVGELFRNDYAIESSNTLDMSRFADGILYKIDGIIANPRELWALQYAYSAPEKETSVILKTIHDPRCGVKGCADAVTQTTTITRTVADPDTETPEDAEATH